jgi:tetratricopeptide (TPR) repeat protein
VLKNRGIALALDLGRLEEARATFAEALARATAAGNAREVLQARLYGAETKLRLQQADEAARDFRAAHAEAVKLETQEEQWKALYGLARCELLLGNDAAADGHLRGAVAVTRNIGLRRLVAGMVRPVEYRLRTTLENHRGDLARSFIRAPRTTVTAFGRKDVLSFGESSLGRRLRQLDLRPTAISRSAAFSGAWTPCTFPSVIPPSRSRSRKSRSSPASTGRCGAVRVRSFIIVRCFHRAGCTIISPNGGTHGNLAAG